MTPPAEGEPLIIGDTSDPHVQAVCKALVERGARPIAVDLEVVMRDGLTISEDTTAVRVNDTWIDLGIWRGGWLRRIHRAPWGLGIETGSVHALELGTWHSAFTWTLDDANIDWVSSPRSLRAAEGKLEQWNAARRLGIDYPRTLVTSRADDVRAAFWGDVLVKPLGSGQFLHGDEVRTVFAEVLATNDSRLDFLSEAPFIVQELLHAERHLRVVTVGQQAWVAALHVPAEEPADWRRTRANHDGFVYVRGELPEVATGAVAIATEFALGYSSQDWVQTSDGRTVLLDLNPSGQWLFLPERVGMEVAVALAERILRTM
ncbi:hypothetical protein B4U78_013545 [Microbacterium esteraromaticum]|nr:hypothetical protein B4U78_013545 [Microbacterium esteraromaticum]